MAKKRVTSKPGLFGYVYHYDENGKCIGKSRPSLMGDGKVHYDANGKQVGTSRPGFIAKEVYHDQESNQYISSYEGLTGDVHYSGGTPAGVTHPGFGDTAYTSLELDDETADGYCEEEEFFAEDQEVISQPYGNDRKTIIINVIVFAACVLFVGVLALIFLK